MIDGFALPFFLLLVVHALVGLTTGIIGVMTFRLPKRQELHPRWGRHSLWAYTLVFLTATILSLHRWNADSSLFFLAVLGYGFALGGYAARRFHQGLWMMRDLEKLGMIAHIVGMIESYSVLWTAFYVDNAHLIPGLNQLPVLTFWVLPSLIGLPFIILSLARFVPKMVVPSSKSATERKEEAQYEYALSKVSVER